MVTYGLSRVLLGDGGILVYKGLWHKGFSYSH
jgi:hypothetical protein